MRSLRGRDAPPQDVYLSRQRQQESDVWQRRFWEHQIRDEADLVGHLNYLHYNPVKHGLVRCPHKQEFSSFWWFVGEGMCGEDWGCGVVDFVGRGWMLGSEVEWWVVLILHPTYCSNFKILKVKG